LSGFVCTWCAGTFPTRAALTDHWAADADCGRNRNVSNQTQSKYQDNGAERVVPGERVLRLVSEMATRSDG
jgi:hypothetical protein